MPMHIKGFWDFLRRPTVNSDDVVIVTDSVDTLDNIDLSGITTGQGVTWNGNDLVPTDIEGSPAGADTQVQYNNGGVFGAEANFTYDDTTGVVSMQADAYAGYSEDSLHIGDTDYGTIQVGNGFIGVCDRVTGNLDMDGSMYFRNAGGVSSNIEFLFLESPGNTVRFAIPKSGVGNATWNPRSMLLAGPDPSDDTAVTVGYWQGVGIFDNLVCDTGGDGADLGVQNDLEVEGDIFIDSIKESTTAAGVTIDGLLIQDSGIGGASATEIGYCNGVTSSIQTQLNTKAISGGAEHDGFSDFVSNEHVNHSSVTLTAGSGMTGGGDITASRTFNVIGANSIDANANDIQLVNDEASPGADQVYGTNGSGTKGWYDTPESIFGSEFDYDESDGASSTTSTAWQTKINMVTATVPVGWYRIQAYAIIYNSDSDKRANARLVVEGTERGILKQVGKNSNDENPVIFGEYEQVTSPETISIQLEYAAGGDGGTVYIQDAHVEFWRVS